MEGCVKMTWRWYACTTTADRLLYLHIYAQSRKHKPFANKTAPIGPYTSTQTCFCDRVLQVEDAARPHRHPPHRHWHSVNHNHSHRHSHRFRHTTTDTHKNTCTLHATHEQFMIVPLDSSTQSLPFHTIFTPFLTR